MTGRQQMAVDLERVRWILLRLWSALDRNSECLPRVVRQEAERAVFPGVFAALGQALTDLDALQEGFWDGDTLALFDSLEQGRPKTAAEESVQMVALIHADLARKLRDEAERQAAQVNHIIEQAARHFFGCHHLPERLVVLKPPHQNAHRTHCKHGHAFTPENTILCRGWRYCRLCMRARRAQTDARRRAARSKQAA